MQINKKDKSYSVNFTSKEIVTLTDCFFEWCKDSMDKESYKSKDIKKLIIEFFAGVAIDD